MITQETKEFAAEAIVAVGSLSLTWDDAQKYAEAALTAAYPLIRNEVLEDVAKEFELWGHDKLAAQRVRNLKDKTDEAHNG